MTDSNNRRDRTRYERRRIGLAIREARGELTQAELGERVGEWQTTISRWENGEVELTLGQAHRLETALGVTNGWIARHAGLVDVDDLTDEDDSDNFIRVGYYDSYACAAEHLAAAAALGLGVRVSNRLVFWDEEEEPSEVWSVALYSEPAGLEV